MKETGNKKLLFIFLGSVIALLCFAAALVLLIDPFYHYHGPLPGLKAVVTKSEYQCIGTIRHFAYDSVLAGSSTAENYNNHWFDEAFGCKTVKAIKSSGGTADLRFYLDEAFATHEIQNIFYSLDAFALVKDPTVNFVDESMPLYLYDRDLFNDVSYLFNKDVIFKDIPYMLAVTFLEEYDEGTSYNWAQDKVFSRQEALKHYTRPEKTEPVLPKEAYEELVEGNIDLLVEMVEAHQGTDFYFLLPPYSLLWWDSMHRTGQLEQYRYAANRAMEKLLCYENVRVYDFRGEASIVLNLDYYMDPIHFSADINYFMVEQAANIDSAYRVTRENYDIKVKEMNGLLERMIEEEIPIVFVQQDREGKS